MICSKKLTGRWRRWKSPCNYIDKANGGRVDQIHGKVEYQLSLHSLRGRNTGSCRIITRLATRKFRCVLVGINLLREGLDLPEVSLVAILDADKEDSSEAPFLHKLQEERPGISMEIVIFMLTKSQTACKKQWMRPTEEGEKQIVYNQGSRTFSCSNQTFERKHHGSD